MPKVLWPSVFAPGQQSLHQGSILSEHLHPINIFFETFLCWSYLLTTKYCYGHVFLLVQIFISKFVFVSKVGKSWS
jgi:hypothetical protein